MRIKRLASLALPLLFLCAVHSSAELPKAAVTYQLSEGRFGDQLLCYLHAKWISYCYGFPLLYKPFRFSTEFALHENEELWSEEKEKTFDHVCWHTKGGDFSTSEEGSTLHVIPFFSGNPDDLQYHPEWAFFPVDWKDDNFRALLRSAFHPRKDPPSFPFPTDKNYLTVALHIRKGGGFDPPETHMLWPLRFPPDSYYIESLRKLCHLFPDRPLFAFLFTDDPTPQHIAASYAEQLKDLSITFAYRKEGNCHDTHVLDDFFAMMQFDCLIRSQSNYSLVPSLIAPYQVVITPKHYVWQYNPQLKLNFENYIDEIDMETSIDFPSIER